MRVFLMPAVFQKLCLEASHVRRLVIVMDGLDKLESSHHGAMLTWLTKEIPHRLVLATAGDGFLTIEVMTMTEGCEALHVLDRMHPQPPHVRLGPLTRERAVEMTSYMLWSLNRSLSVEQAGECWSGI